MERTQKKTDLLLHQPMQSLLEKKLIHYINKQINLLMNK